MHFNLLAGISGVNHRILPFPFSKTNSFILFSQNKKEKKNTFSAKPVIEDQVVTPDYRVPEVLLGRTNYSAAIDMWAVGRILAKMMRGECPFGGMFESDVLFGIFRPGAETLPDVVSLSESRSSWLTHIDKLNLGQELIRFELDGLEILFRMLCLNPTTRTTAKSALDHGYFKNIQSSLFSPRYDSFLFP